MFRLAVAVLLFCLSTLVALAGEVDVRHARFEQQPAGWHVSVTLLHGDQGWSHYADAWRVVDGQGRVLATRTLYHPHDKEQPFTRHLSGVTVPPETTIVFIEAHDTVHGWSKRRLRVDLTTARGAGYEVRRRKF